MKNQFIGFYNPTEKEINDSWTNGIFSFDANTLLNLYRYTELTRTDFLGALKTIKKKLFLSHQAALEYHTNRLGVIEGIEYSYSVLYELFENNFENNLKSQINQFKKHPAIKTDNILKLYDEFLKKVSEELDKEKKNHPDFKTDDKVLTELTELFDGSIGKEFSKQELKKIYEEGKDRYLENIPPGFKDLDSKRKKGDRHIYGDLIIWKELIEFTKKEKKPLIFVTDDRKEDWWTIENGKTIRPREELIKEFFDMTGIRILIYNADSFLHYAKEKKYVPHLKENTIKEVKEIRVSDEKSYAKMKDFRSFVNTKSLEELLSDSDFPRQKTVRDLLSEDTFYRPKIIRDLLNDESNRQSTIKDLLNNESIRQRTVKDLLNEELHRSKTINDFISEGRYLRPRTVRDLSSQDSPTLEKTISNEKETDEVTENDLKNEDQKLPDKNSLEPNKKDKKKK